MNDNDNMDGRRVELALDIYNEARFVTASELAEGMKRALEAADEETLEKIREEFGV